MATVKKVSSKRHEASRPVPKPGSKKRTKSLAAPVAPDAPAKPKNASDASSAKAKSKPAKKSKPLRDTFRMPAADFDTLRTLKSRAASLGVPARKSEILRAGLRTLQRMDDEQLAVLLASVQSDG